MAKKRAGEPPAGSEIEHMLDTKDGQNQTGKDTPTRDQKTSNNSLGLKGFNNVGREEGSTVILRPKVDPAVTRRNIFLIGLVILAFCLIGYVARQRSGVPFIPTDDAHGPSLGEAAQQQRSGPQGP